MQTDVLEREMDAGPCQTRAAARAYHEVGRAGPLRMTRDSRGVLTIELGSSVGALARVLRRVGRDSRNQVVILSGLERQMRPDHPVAGEVLAVLEAIAGLPTPVIAVAEGPVRNHLEIALLADVVIVGAKATFDHARPVAQRPSADPAIRALWRHRIGRAPADAFLLSPWPLSATRAYAWTLASEVVGPGGALPRALALAGLYLAVSEATRRRLRAEFIAPTRRILAPLGLGDIAVSRGEATFEIAARDLRAAA